VHYAYQLPDVAIASLVEYQAEGMPDMITNERVIKDEIESGADTLGAFLMSPDFGKWWCGSKLTIEESRRLIPHQNATIVQVSPSIIAGIVYMIQNPDKSPVFPEDLPEDYVMNSFIKCYLGTWISQSVNWEPSGKTMLPKYKKEKREKEAQQVCARLYFGLFCILFCFSSTFSSSVFCFVSLFVLFLCDKHQNAQPTHTRAPHTPTHRRRSD
jgi:homospermidine synthase